MGGGIASAVTYRTEVHAAKGRSQAEYGKRERDERRLSACGGGPWAERIGQGTGQKKTRGDSSSLTCGRR